MAERISSEHGFDALALQLKREFAEVSPASGAQVGGAIDKAMSTMKNMRLAVNEHDADISALKEQVGRLPFPVGSS